MMELTRRFTNPWDLISVNCGQFSIKQKYIVNLYFNKCEYIELCSIKNCFVRSQIMFCIFRKLKNINVLKDYYLIKIML